LIKEPSRYFTALNDICESWSWLPYVASFAIFAALTYLQTILSISDGGG
jgi:hypothetical protein